MGGAGEARGEGEERGGGGGGRGRKLPIECLPPDVFGGFVSTVAGRCLPVVLGVSIDCYPSGSDVWLYAIGSDTGALSRNRQRMFLLARKIICPKTLPLPPGPRPLRTRTGIAPPFIFHRRVCVFFFSFFSFVFYFLFSTLFFQTCFFFF